MPSNFSELEGHDAYELLGVAPDASVREIQKAYRKLATSHHPDKFPGGAEKEAAQGRIRLLNAARDVLTGRRSEYDALRHADDVDDPADEEVIDDPWGTAQAGTPPPRPAPAYSPPPPPTPVTWEPAGYRPTRPPRYGQPPQARPPARPMRLRDHQWRRPVGCASVLIAIFVTLLVISEIEELSSPSAPEASASVPGSLAGTWKGTVSNKNSQGGTWPVQLTLHAGEHTGDIDYKDGACSGTAVPVSYEGGTLTVSTDFSDGQDGCDVGDLQIVSKRRHHVAITYRDKNGKVLASGDLKAA